MRVISPFPSSLAIVFTALLVANFPIINEMGKVSAAEPHKTLEWIREVNDTFLTYHCRIKFGDDPSKLVFSPKTIDAKWEAIQNILNQVPGNGNTGKWNEIDSRMVAVFKRQEVYEKYVFVKERELETKMNFLIFRLGAEALGGEDVKKFFNAMPDGLDIKQDIPSVVGALVKAGVKLSDLRWEMAVSEKEAFDFIRENAGTDAVGLMKEINRLHNSTSIGKFELAWLTENRPGLLDRMMIKSAGALRDLHQRLDTLLKEQTLANMKQYGGKRTRRFLLYRDWAILYEKEKLLWLAVRQYEEAEKLFWPAHQEAMLNVAQHLEAANDWFGAIRSLQQSTLRLVNKSYNEPGFIVTDPMSRTILARQAEAADGKLGFLGSIEIAAPPIDLELIDKGQRAVLLCQAGLLTYDLNTGKREHLMFDQKSGVKLIEMAVTIDGKYAYVVSSEPAIQRFNLTDGTRDTKFISPPVERDDTKIAISPDGKHLATELFGKAKIFNAHTGTLEKELEVGGLYLIYGIEFSPDGQYLAFHGNGPEIGWREIQSDRVIKLLIIPDGNIYVYTLDHQMNGKIIASGNGVLTIWGKNNLKQPSFHTQLPNSSSGKFLWADVTPDGKYVVSSHGIWNYKTGGLVVRFNPSWNPKAMAMTPDGQRLILTTQSSLFVIPLALTKPDE